jgi:hypothetical protein
MLNLWSYTSTFSIHLHGVQWHNELLLTTSWLTECVYFILTNNDIEEQNSLLILTLSTKILPYFHPCFCMHQGLSSFELSKPMMKVGYMTLLPSLSRDPITSMPVTMMTTPTPVICTNTTRLTASISNRHIWYVINTKIHYYPPFRIFLYLQNLHVCPIYGYVLMLTTALSSVSSFILCCITDK